MLPRLSSKGATALVLLAALLASVSAQSSTSSGPSPAPSTSAPSPSTSLPSSSLPVSLSLTTASSTLSTDIRNGTTLLPVVTVIPITFNVTIAPTPTSSAVPSATSSAPPDPRHLDTKLDPAFGVIGAVLILTGIPSAFLGHKNRWTSFFLIGFYTLSLVCLCLILRFGVLEAVNPPSKSVRGLFVLACAVAGVAGGGVAIFFWKATKFFIGAWGGLAFALWIQCFNTGGLIHPIGYRWLMFIGCTVVGFILCTIPALHYYVVIISTAFVGATAFMLGVDCFSLTGVKEFYIWNLGFNTIFDRYVSLGIQFPVTQTMEIELGLLGAVAIMGIAIQLRILKVLQRKLAEIRAEQQRLDQEQEARATALFSGLDEEKAEWERNHPALLKNGRLSSTLSDGGLLKDTETAVGSPSSDDEKHSSSSPSMGNISPRPRYQSGVSTLMGSLVIDGRQSPGAIPALDLGLDLEDDVPKNYLSADASATRAPNRNRNSSGTMSILQDLDDLKKKEELLNEIQNIRKSIEVLKTDSPVASSPDDSRRPSFASRRTLSQDLSSFASHLRPPRPADSRARTHSMDLLNTRTNAPDVIGRSTSAPLQNMDEAWEAYLHERKLLQPPSGVSPPIPTTPITLANPTPRLAVPPAVTEALNQRQQRELSYGRLSPESREPASADKRQSATAAKERSPEDLPLALRPTQHKKTGSQGSYAPGVILPSRHRIPSTPLPASASQTKPAEAPARVMSPEALEARHREQLRQMQQPITQAEREQAEVEAARSRWERAKQMEKVAVTKRQAEQAALVSRKEKEERKQRAAEGNAKPRSQEEDSAKKPQQQQQQQQQQAKSLSQDVLATVGQQQGLPTPVSSRRQSARKVEDWQRHQADELGRVVGGVAAAATRPKGPSASRRASGVPFPADAGPPARDSRRLSGMMLAPRDPPS